MKISELSLGNNITLVVVTKNHTIDEIQPLYNQGARYFGENRIEELITKYDHFSDVNWHFIGRIQTKKISKIVKFCDLIHSVSSIKHIEKIDTSAKNINKIQNILLQINIANEVTKDGFSVGEIGSIISISKQYENINVQGLMVIGNHTKNLSEISKTFTLAKDMQLKYNLPILSMGMSNDYQLAVSHGTTLVRIGSLLFE